MSLKHEDLLGLCKPGVNSCVTVTVSHNGIEYGLGHVVFNSDQSSDEICSELERYANRLVVAITHAIKSKAGETIDE